MSDLHGRLTAAVNSRLEVARSAKNHTGRWRWDHGFGDMCNDAECPYGMLLDEATEAEEGTVVMHVHGYDITEPWQGGPHIVANDPATVIRHCERDLRVLERHAPVHIGGPAACKHAWADGNGWIEDYPCDEIRDLATAYDVEAEPA